MPLCKLRCLSNTRTSRVWIIKLHIFEYKALLKTLCCQTVRLASVLADYYTMLFNLGCISVSTKMSESYNYSDLNTSTIATHDICVIVLSNWQIRVCVWRLLCHRLLVERESCTHANTCTFRMGSSREITSPRACAHGVFALSSTEKKFATRRSKRLNSVLLTISHAWSLSSTADCQRNGVKSFLNSVCC